jgi:hypothetical protein
MADELDPRLEASLRTALHHEADALPFLIRSDDIERARRRRGGKRLALPASLLGLAAVLAILVVTGVIGRGLQGNIAASPLPRPTATDRPLVSYELLLGMLGATEPADLRGEQPVSGPAGDPVNVELGTLTAPGSIHYAIHCLGGPVTLTLDDGGANPDTVLVNCAAQPMTQELPGSERPYRVSVMASPAVRWRIVMTASGAAPSADPAPRRLESMADLEAALVAMAPAMPVIARGEHLDAGGATGPVTTELGPIGAYRFMSTMVDCVGGDIKIAVMDGAVETSSFNPPCGPTSKASTDGIGSPATGNRIVVTADAAVRWRVVVSVSSLECTPLGADATDRSLTVVGDVPTPIDTVGTMSWRTVDGATITGDTGSLPALGRPLTVNLADGLGVDPGQHCFEQDGVEAGILPLADYDAARASGAEPSFKALAVETVRDSRAVSIPLLRPGTLPTGAQVIRLKAAWHRADGKRDIETWLIPVMVTTTGIGPVLPFEDLAVHAESTVGLLRNEHAATSAAERTVAGHVGAVANVEVVLSCDTGTVTLGFQSGNTTYPASDHTSDCGQGATSVVLPSPAQGGDGAELTVDAPAGTTWRLIAYDHDAALRPSIEDALPLPAPKAGQTVESIIGGIVDGGAPSNTSVEVYARPQGTTFQVVYACEGPGTIHVTLEGLTKDAACTSAGSMSFTPSGFAPSTLTVTSDKTVRLNLELRSNPP